MYYIWGFDIKKIEVIRETDKCLFVPDKWSKKGERRQNKDGNEFHTFAEAKAALIIELERRHERAVSHLARVSSALDRARLLTPDQLETDSE